MALGNGKAAQASGRLWPLGRRSSRNPPALLASALGIDPAEGAEIDARLAVAGVADLHFRLRLCWSVQPLVRRAVPLRVIERGPVPRTARLRFADGCTVVVSSPCPGSIGALALAMKRGSVRPVACRPGPGGGIQLLLARPPGTGLFCLEVLGLDQPD